MRSIRSVPILMLYILLGCAFDKPDTSYISNMNYVDSMTKLKSNQFMVADNIASVNNKFLKTVYMIDGRKISDEKSQRQKLYLSLSKTYFSPNGKVHLHVDEHGHVTGSFSYNEWSGVLSGTFDDETLNIRGSYMKVKSFLFYQLDQAGQFIIQFGRDGDRISIKNSAQREKYSDIWHPWGLTFPSEFSKSIKL